MQHIYWNYLVSIEANIITNREAYIITNKAHVLFILPKGAVGN